MVLTEKADKNVAICSLESTKRFHLSNIEGLITKDFESERKIAHKIAQRLKKERYSEE